MQTLVEDKKTAKFGNNDLSPMEVTEWRSNKIIDASNITDFMAELAAEIKRNMKEAK